MNELYFYDNNKGSTQTLTIAADVSRAYFGLGNNTSAWVIGGSPNDAVWVMFNENGIRIMSFRSVGYSIRDASALLIYTCNIPLYYIFDITM